MHQNPEKAATDGQQTLDFSQFDELMRKVGVLRELIH